MQEVCLLKKTYICRHTYGCRHNYESVFVSFIGNVEVSIAEGTRICLSLVL